MNFIRHFYYAARGRLLRHFPRSSLCTLEVLADYRHRFPTPLRRELESNLRLAFPTLGPNEITQLARNVLVTNLVDAAAQYRLELLPAPLLTSETRAMRVVGEVHLERAAAAGHRVILVTPHYGLFMQAALQIALGRQDRPVYFFYNPSERNPYADTSDALIDRIDGGCIKIHHDRKGVITALRALKKGATLCLMPDQITPEGETVYVPFFGNFFGVMQGVAFFSLKANALIIPLYCRAGPDGVRVLEYRPPLVLPPDPGLGEPARLYQITAAVFAEIERQFRLAPAHWRYWTQFRSRSLVSPVPPKSPADLLAQLEQVRRRVAGVAPAATVVGEWREILRRSEADADDSINRP